MGWYCRHRRRHLWLILLRRDRRAWRGPRVDAEDDVRSATRSIAAACLRGSRDDGAAGLPGDRAGRSRGSSWSAAARAARTAANYLRVTTATALDVTLIEAEPHLYHAVHLEPLSWRAEAVSRR